MEYLDEKDGVILNKYRDKAARVGVIIRRGKDEVYNPDKHDTAKIWRMLKEAGIKADSNDITIKDGSRKIGKGKNIIERGRFYSRLSIPLS